MAGLLDVLKTPEGLGLLMSGVGSAVSGDPRFLNNNVQLQAAFDDLQMRRQAVAEGARKKQRLAQLPGLLADLQAYPADLQPGRKMEAMGLLAEFAPEAAMTGLLGEVFPKREEVRSSPEEARMMRELNIPLTEEGYARFKQLRGTGDANALAAIRDALEISKLRGEIGDKNAERGRTEDQRTKDRALAERGFNRNLGQLRELSGLNEELRGTLLEAGVPFSDLRRALASGGAFLGEKVGYNTSQLKDKVAKADRLSKGLNDIIIENKDRFGQNFTNNMLDLLQRSSANKDIAPEAINSILGKLTEQILDVSDIEGYNISDIEAATDFAKRMKLPLEELPLNPVVDMPGAIEAVRAGAGRAADAAGTAARDVVVRAADIARMSEDQIRKLDVDNMTPELLQAIEQRVMQLRMRK